MRVLTIGAMALLLFASGCGPSGLRDNGSQDGTGDDEGSDGGTPTGQPGGSGQDGGIGAVTDGGSGGGGGGGGGSNDAGTQRCVPTPGATLLSQTCLYSDISRKAISPEALAYQPAHALWSDQAAKQRWIRLPEGATVNTSDMDHWSFPVGTQLFKEFAIAGKPIETRLIERTGASAYRMVSFIWNSAGTEATANPDGATNVGGTSHDVPSSTDCERCHGGEPGRVLGFSALQLSTSGPGVTLDALASQGRLSAPPPAGTRYPAPGTTSEAAALGYLHANCGHCHNPNGAAYDRVNMVLRLSVSERTVPETALYRTTVDVRTQASSSTRSYRIASGDSAGSEVVNRMGQRGTRSQMPPLGTEQVDSTGLGLLRAWIDAL